MAPKDEGEMRDMLLTMIEHVGPAAMRYPRGSGVGADIARSPQLLESERARYSETGGEVAIIAYGSMVHPALQAAENLAKEKIETTVVNARFVKPLDSQLLLALRKLSASLSRRGGLPGRWFWGQRFWNCWKKRSTRHGARR